MTSFTSLGADQAHSEENSARRVDAVIPGSCLGAIPSKKTPVVFSSGQGSKLVDVEGREYIDYVMGSGPLLLGHAHPDVVGAVKSSAALGSTFFALNEPAINLAEYIASAAPSNKGVRFQTTGSEGVQVALRIARAATNRRKILRFEGGFHGGSDFGLTSSSPKHLEASPNPVADCAGLSPSVVSETFVAPFNDLDATESILKAHGKEIAAIVLEPVQRIIVPKDGFLEGLRRLADEYGVLVIYDEVVTGFRLAWGGGQEMFGVPADLVVYGKVIGGGYPISAISGRWDLLNLCDPANKAGDTYVFASGTLTGNPVSAAAGLATLGQVKKPGFHKTLHERAAQLAAGLTDVFRSAGVEASVLQVGSLIQVMFDCTEAPVNFWDMQKANAKKGKVFADAMYENGVNYLTNFKWYVSAAHTEEDVETTLKAAHQAIQAVRTV
ncbi:MAG: aminotransferase class III-fold pyridoxal phosphate-dependent enzyme [Pseudomonadota bacterium]